MPTRARVVLAQPHEVHDVLHRLRTANHHTPATLANHTGFRTAQVLCWEDGSKRPNLRFACEAHAPDLATELCDRYGGSNSIPLRMTWRYWLTTRLYAARKWRRP